MADQTALDAVKHIMESRRSNKERAMKIVSQMFWHPGPDDRETWEAVLEAMLTYAEAERAGKPVDG